MKQNWWYFSEFLVYQDADSSNKNYAFSIKYCSTFLLLSVETVIEVINRTITQECEFEDRDKSIFLTFFWLSRFWCKDENGFFFRSNSTKVSNETYIKDVNHLFLQIRDFHYQGSSIQLGFLVFSQCGYHNTVSCSRSSFGQNCGSGDIRIAKGTKNIKLKKMQFFTLYSSNRFTNFSFGFSFGFRKFFPFCRKHIEEERFVMLKSEIVHF